MKFNKARCTYVVIAVIIIALVGLFLLNGIRQADSDNLADKSLTKIRIGYQIPWATQGQLVQILMKTDILAKNGLEADFIGRTYGPDLNELALADQIDVVLTGDQPGIALIAKQQGWIGVGRLMYNRTSTYVPVNSEIMSMNDLRGKTIAIPIGAAAERLTIKALKHAGIDSNEIRIVNLAITEQAALLQKYNGRSTMGNIDALSGFDPVPAILEAKGMTRTLDVGTVCSLIIMNEDFILEDKSVAERLINAFSEAYYYYAQNTQQANNWFIENCGLNDMTQDICNQCASIEPNVTVKSLQEVRMSFSENDFAILQEAADFLNIKIDIRDYIYNTYAGQMNVG